jgi:hypothetical protein
MRGFFSELMVGLALSAALETPMAEKLPTPIIDCGIADSCTTDTVFTGSVLLRLHLPDAFLQSLGDNRHGVGLWSSEDTTLAVTNGIGDYTNPWGYRQFNRSVCLVFRASCADGYYEDSDVLRLRYTRELLPPVSSPEPCEFEGLVTVSLQAEIDVRIFYTTNGAEPDTNAQRYNAPINISATTEIKAFAYRDSCKSSRSEIFLFTHRPYTSCTSRAESTLGLRANPVAPSALKFRLNGQRLMRTRPIGTGHILSRGDGATRDESSMRMGVSRQR